MARAVAAITAAWLVMVTNAGAGAAPCFEDLEQHYEYDDDGYNWRIDVHFCPEDKAAAPADRKRTGSIDIRVSGDEATIIELEDFWAVKEERAPTGCPPTVKFESRRVRVMTGGIVYETMTGGGLPASAPSQQQRPAHPHETLAISGTARLVRPSKYMDFLGDDNILGFPCRRVAANGIFAGANWGEMCILNGPPPLCPKSNYLLPLEVIRKTANGELMWHGKTTLLRYGALGSIVPPHSMHAP